MSAVASQEWFTLAELAKLSLPGLPTTKRGLQDLALRAGWATSTDAEGDALSRPRRARGGGTEYHLSLLPDAARARLMQQAAEPAVAERTDRESAWMRYERLSASMKAEAKRRLEIIQRVETLMRGGLMKSRAVDEVVAQARREARAGGEADTFSVSTLNGWFARIAGVQAADRLAYLAPSYTGRVAVQSVDPELMDLYKADYLRPSEPRHAESYSRILRIAEARGLSLPSAKTMQRRLEAEVPRPLQILARQGMAAADHSFPHRTRDRSSLAPMQIVNLDGHMWDVLVVWPDGTKGRAQSLAVQDIASGKMLAIRFDKTLNHHLVRLALSDVFRDFGLPETVIMDNGRENAAAAISGGQTSCWRWAQEEKPAGLLTSLGIKAHFAKPYWGQAKPIERAFRNYAQEIARHPAFEGAYTGRNTVEKPDNYGSRYIPIAEFEAIVRAEMAAQNERIGRRGIGMNGRSFDQAFAEGVERTGLRRATQEQLRMALLASQPVTLDARENTVKLHGGRYWSPELANLKRQKVTVRFDPDNLTLPVHVYSLDGRYLCAAAQIAAGSFDNVADARAQSKDLAAYRKDLRSLEKRAIKLGAADVAAALPTPSDPIPLPDPKVIRPAFGAATRADQAGKPRDFSAAWARSARAATGGG